MEGAAHLQTEKVNRKSEPLAERLPKAGTELRGSAAMAPLTTPFELGQIPVGRST
jgi:hypothetical protein